MGGWVCWGMDFRSAYVDINVTAVNESQKVKENGCRGLGHGGLLTFKGV